MVFGPVTRTTEWLSCEECEFRLDLRDTKTFKYLKEAKYYCKKGKNLEGYLKRYPKTPEWCPVKKED